MLYGIACFGGILALNLYEIVLIKVDINPALCCKVHVNVGLLQLGSGEVVGDRQTRNCSPGSRADHNVINVVIHTLYKSRGIE